MLFVFNIHAFYHETVPAVEDQVERTLFQQQASNAKDDNIQIKIILAKFS